jgi:ergothioneine biosynthesis protein EgtB
MPDASPAKWHLAHTTWFFEVFVLQAFVPGYRPFQAPFIVLFNSYYNGVGARHERSARGLITRPGLDDIKSYRAAIDEQVLHGLTHGRFSPQACERIELGIQHEQQHQELLLTDLLHLLWCNPVRPAYRAPDAPPSPGDIPSVEHHQDWLTIGEQLGWVGHSGQGFSFDNEGPRHRVWVDSYQIAKQPVTQGEWLAFMDDGGYERPELWLAAGWDQIQREQWHSPLYWTKGAMGWEVFSLRGQQPMQPNQVMAHVSYFEADAFARWADASLPTESQWELAATDHALGPRLSFLDGAIWQWTSSDYAAYPGFRPVAGAIGEYNGKFMVNQLVLRGGSCATPAGHSRPSYRNFFPAAARWQFSGLRLARNA